MSGAAVICEIMNEDGTMARMPQLKEFAEKHNLRIITIDALIRHRRTRETLVEEVAKAELPTVFGAFEVRVFREKLTGVEHVALVRGRVDQADEPLVRVHSECLTGDVFRSLRCDCRSQLDAALNLIAEEGCGVLLRMAQEGRGIGLAAKIKAYGLQDSLGLDTVEANTHLGYRDDLRDYGVGAQILRHLGLTRMRLLTNNPRKIVGLSAYGIEITRQLPLIVGESEANAKYLRTKREKLGHTI
jgi:3,4-dihydroxy 2-butanone 4-phosphate synthase/GTP cyclohydrolase II